MAYEDYKIMDTEPIGSGGNAKVYLAKNLKTGDMVALKELKTGGKFFKEKKDRFCIETRLVQKIQDSVKGIIPIYDAGLPDRRNKKYWYAMPIAEPIANKFSGQESIEEIANCIIELANVMDVLHKRGIVHRDIKPSNIYFYKGAYCFGDFGLVDYPEKENLTKLKEPVGAKATIAPEMKRDAKNSDGKKADVYSLAKTLWMLLTHNETGFDGTYDAESKLMGLSVILKREHIVELEELLYDSTREEPELRPTMEQFARRLAEWIDIKADYEKSNLSQWKYIQNTLFGKIVPDSAKWSNIDDIITVLNLLGRMPNINHMFVPSGGGEDFEKAEKAEEEGCICIKSLGNVIVKPKCLYAENVEKDYIWSYFRLELEELQPIFEIVEEQIYENLTEDVSGHYISWKCGNYGYYDDGTPLPANYRIVYRYLKGSFVIFAKSSIYNDISGTYDARHSKMTAEQFRDYIVNLRMCSLVLPYETFMNLANKNPFVQEEDSFEKEERKKRRERYTKCKEFIKENITEWSFLQNIGNTSKSQDEKIGYYIKYQLSGGYFDKKYLCKNGKIQSESDETKRNLVFDKDSAIKLVDDIKNFIRKQCEEAEIEFDIGYEQIFEIGIQRLGKPVHIFSMEELEKELRNGDDSKHNRLVIDADGYIRLIEEGRYPHLYPVRFEEYVAYNDYVGKYADLSDLSDEYTMCLQGWLLYLKTNRAVYMDYVHNNVDNEKLLEEIKEYY
ncbi:MAG: protein kinase [Lachnospiraceae bacterium]|nr:protein kinase [Lachnospiraceae bacterium]